MSMYSLNRMQNAKKNSVNLIISGLFSSDSCAESSFLNSVRSEDNNQRHQKQKYRMHFFDEEDVSRCKWEPTELCDGLEF